jgi:Fe-Mn family superoxide dismutase
MKTSKTNEWIDSVVKAAVSQSINGGCKSLNEAYVAEPKPFKQVSELVSQKTKDAHVALYKEYVDATNKVSAELDTADRSSSSSKHSDFRSLKLDEAYNLNAMWLHELYFANCFDPHSEIVMDSIAYLKLQASFGTFEDWQRDFIACANSCGNGWAVCGYHTFLRRYVNVMVSNHSQDVMLGLYPVIVVDGWEHAYVRDYLTDKRSYIVAMMRQFNWTVIEDRFKRAEAIGTAVK